MVHVILLNTGFYHRSGRDRHAYFECGIDRQRPVLHLGMMAGTDRGGLERHMKNIVDEDGEIVAKAADDHTLIGGHHRLAVAASLVKNCSGKIPASLCGLIPSSREVLIDNIPWRQSSDRLIRSCGLKRCGRRARWNGLAPPTVSGVNSAIGMIQIKLGARRPPKDFAQ